MEDTMIPVVQCVIWIDCSKYNMELLTYEDKQCLIRIPELPIYEDRQCSNCMTQRKTGIFELRSDNYATWDVGETIEFFLKGLQDDVLSFLRKHVDNDFISSSLSIPIRFGSTPPSLFLSRELLDTISALGLDIDFDLYPFLE